MHILIGLITAIAGLVWALHNLQRSGLDLNSFNPFYWIRRRQWQKKLGAKPLHRLENTIEAAAVLMVATAKLEGDLSREQKQLILDLFSKEFKLSETEAQNLYIASCHLLRSALDITAEVKHILAPSIRSFTPAQKESLLKMLADIANEESPANKEQLSLIAQVEQQFEVSVLPNEWAI